MSGEEISVMMNLADLLYEEGVLKAELVQRIQECLMSRKNMGTVTFSSEMTGIGKKGELQ